MGKTRSVSSAQMRAKLIGTPFADFIKASGSSAPHQQAGHMAAPDRAASKTLLRERGRPHMRLGGFRCTTRTSTSMDGFGGLDENQKRSVLRDA